MENKGEKKQIKNCYDKFCEGGDITNSCFQSTGHHCCLVGDAACSGNKLGRTQAFCSKASGNSKGTPEAAACERGQQGLEQGQMDRSVLPPRRWQAEPAGMGREKLRAQKGDWHGFTWLQTGEGAHLDLHKHEQDCSWEEKARFKER